uniref:Uncharacterized protein n=1 Tax=Sphaerodactylus townsendi TaxID=933632 RepID=A0ACB8GC62_9SAUR
MEILHWQNLGLIALQNKGTRPLSDMSSTCPKSQLGVMGNYQAQIAAVLYQLAVLIPAHTYPCVEPIDECFGNIPCAMKHSFDLRHSTSREILEGIGSLASASAVSTLARKNRLHLQMSLALYQSPVPAAQVQSSVLPSFHP